MEQFSRVCAYIDLDLLQKNLDAMRANMRNDTKMLGVIKTDAYGHGAVPIAWEMESLDYVFGYAVATIEEAIQLRKSSIKKPILILGYTFPYSYKTLVEYDIRPTVFKKDMLHQIDDVAKKEGKKLPIHIKVDTGMSRIGIFPDESGKEFIKEALECENLIVEGIFTHFARADERNKDFTNKQYKLFSDFVLECEKEFHYKFPYKHCSNSSGIIDMPNVNDDLVRAGISLYGIWPSAEVNKSSVPLKPILSLKSHIIYIKTIESGTPISYGGTFVTNKRTVVATIPVGYGDGYPRNLSNTGYVLIHGKKAPIIGRICMDQFMIDVTDIPCIEGDEVTLIGKDGSSSISIEELGELSGRFHYELACDIGKRIPRIFLKNNKAVYSTDYYEDVKIISL